MEHCHNTQHEDHAMLLRWDIEYPGQIKLMPAPIPTWDGVEYVDSAALPTFRSGDGTGPSNLMAPPSPGDPEKARYENIGTAEVTAVNVDRVRYLALAQKLYVEGTAPPSALKIDVHEGEPSLGKCTGALLGSTEVDADGTWYFSRGRLETVPATVCARAPLSGSDDSLNVSTSSVSRTDADVP
jgi:hypothetical protein